VGFLVFSEEVKTLRAGRLFLRRHLLNCVFIPDNKATPFIEVLVADGLTSLAKVFYDFGVVLCFVPSFTVAGFHLHELGSVADVCVHNSFPFFMWSTSFIIRARQCIICAKHTKDEHLRFMHYCNMCKYLSVFPVIVFANLCHNYPDSKYIQHYQIWGTIAYIVNTTYCFTWDIFMDWGLGQPNAKNCGLHCTTRRSWPTLWGESFGLLR
jgi:hypothetical protein